MSATTAPATTGRRTASRSADARTIHLLGGLACGVLAVAAWGLGVSPRFSQAGDAQAQAQAQEQANARTSTRIDALEGQLANGQTMLDEAAALSVRYPATADTATLLRDLGVAGQAAGVADKAMTQVTPGSPVLSSGGGPASLPGQGVGGQALAAMPLSVTATAPLDQSTRLVGQLTNLRRALLLGDVKLTAVQGASWQLTADGTLLLLNQDDLGATVEQVKALQAGARTD